MQYDCHGSTNDVATLLLTDPVFNDRLCRVLWDGGDSQQLLTDGGAVEHPGLEAGAAEEYDGDQECAYSCGSAAEYRVELRLNGAATTAVICNDCSQRHRIWVEENELLEADINEEAR